MEPLAFGADIFGRVNTHFCPSGNRIPLTGHSECGPSNLVLRLLAYTARTDAVILEASRAVPKTGEVNQKFGVYKSTCCGYEIVITEGATFPFCPDHLPLITIWKLLPDEDMTDVTGKKRSASKRAA